MSTTIFRTTVFGLLVALLATWWAAPSATSAAATVTMNEPQPVSDIAVALSGTGPASTTITIQRQAANKVWLAFRKVTTDAAGTYSTDVAIATEPRLFRALSGAAVSEVRIVAPAAAEPEPAPTPEPEPTPEPGPTPEPEEPVQPADGCGPLLQKADGSDWTCTLADDFEGTTLDRGTWRPANGFLSGTGPNLPCFVDDPSVVSVSDGALQLSVRRLAAPAACPGAKGEPTPYVAGGVDTYRLFSQQYGRFEARYKSTAATDAGLHEAFWLWPDDRYNTAIWPAAGEIDIAETYSQHPDLAVPFLHYTWYDNWGPVPGLNTSWGCTARRGEYNTFTLEWEPKRLEIRVNGRTCLVNTSGDAAFQKPYIIALTQMLGVGANAYDGSAPLPATMSVDYVRVWK